MSKVHPDDEKNTIRQIRNSSSGNEEGTTWLRHKNGSEAGFIDSMVLSGKYSVDDMIDEIINNPSFRKKSRSLWKRRIKNHLEHLSTIEGDSPNRISGLGGHNLKINVSSSGSVFFDY